MAPHYIILAIGLGVLAAAQLLVSLDGYRDEGPADPKSEPHGHPVGPRLQRMP
jgi:hypothetical protein